MKDLKKIEEEYLRENDNEILHVYDRHAALENLWHSADDKPEKGKWILYKSVYGGYYECRHTYPASIVDKWLYIDELEPSDL